MPVKHIHSSKEADPVRLANMRGGDGEILKRSLFEVPGPNSVFSSMAIITIPPGSSIGVHVHTGEEEAYLIISGTGMCTTEKGTFPVGPGDVAICYDGERHGLANTSDADLVMAGIICKRC